MTPPTPEQERGTCLGHLVSQQTDSTEWYCLCHVHTCKLNPLIYFVFHPRRKMFCFVFTSLQKYSGPNTGVLPHSSGAKCTLCPPNFCGK